MYLSPRQMTVFRTVSAAHSVGREYDSGGGEAGNMTGAGERREYDRVGVRRRHLGRGVAPRGDGIFCRPFGAFCRSLPFA